MQGKILMLNQSNNLLINLHRWAFKQDENFTTESFVHLLNHLLVDEPKIAIRILRKLTDDFLRLKVREVANVQIIAQPITDSGRPDIEISVGNYLVYIEVKVESEINENQLKRYRKVLKGCEDKQTKLIVLSKYPISSDLEIKPDLAVRWYQVADWLERELRSDRIEPLTRFFIEQLIEFLAKQNMVIKRVKSKISESLKSYQKKVPNYPKVLGNMRSMKRLEEIQELRPVYDLMILMKDALTVLENKVKFRFLSGQHKGGWMGFGFNRMDYFLSIYYENPEIVVFDTYSFKIDQSKFDGKLGKTWQEGKRLRWMNELNLVSDGFDFFAETKESQMRTLKNFIRQSYNYVQKIKA
jgi:hypothetical protein